MTDYLVKLGEITAEAASPPSSLWFVKFVESPTGQYAYAFRGITGETYPRLDLYKRVGDGFVLILAGDSGVKNSGTAAWHNDGLTLAVTYTDNYTSHSAFKVLSIDADDDSVTELPFAVPLASTVSVIAWHPIDYLLFGGDGNSSSVLFRISAGQVEVEDASFLVAGSFHPAQIIWSRDGNYVASRDSSSSPPIQIYAVDGETYAQLTIPAGVTLVSSYSTIDFSPDSKNLVLRATRSSPYINMAYIVGIDDGTLTLLSTKTFSGTLYGTSVPSIWSKDSKILCLNTDLNVAAAARYSFYKVLDGVVSDIAFGSGTTGGPLHIGSPYHTFGTPQFFADKFGDYTRLWVPVVQSDSGNTSDADTLLFIYKIEAGTISRITPFQIDDALPFAAVNAASSVQLNGEQPQYLGVRWGQTDAYPNTADVVYRYMLGTDALAARLQPATMRFNPLSGLSSTLGEATAKFSERGRIHAALAALTALFVGPGKFSSTLQDAVAALSAGGAASIALSDAEANITGDGAPQAAYNVSHLVDFDLGQNNVFCPPSISTDETYIVIASGSSPSVEVVKRTGTEFAVLSDALVPDLVALGYSSVYHAKISPDGNYLAVSASGTTPCLLLYKRDGDVFNQISSPDVLPDGDDVYELAWSPDSIYLSAAVYELDNTQLFVYKRTDDTFNKLGNPPYPTSVYAYEQAWSPDGVYLAVVGDGEGAFAVLKRDGDDFTLLDGPDVPPDSSTNTNSPSWSADSGYLAISNPDGTDLPSLLIYRLSDDVLTKIETPTIPDIDGGSTGFSPTFPLFAFAGGHALSAADSLSLYVQSGDSFESRPDLPDEIPPIADGAAQRYSSLVFGSNYLVVVSDDTDGSNNDIGTTLSIYSVIAEVDGGGDGGDGGSEIELTLSSSLVAYERANASLVMLVADALNVDAQTAARMIQQLALLSVAEIDQLLTLQMQKTAILIDNPQANADISSMLSASAYVRDVAAVDAVLLLEGIPFAAWVVNAESGALSEYRNWDFDSMCRLGDRYYGVSEAGLFLLDGPDDDGDPIQASFKTGDLDFGSPQIKRPIEAHIGYTATGDLLLKVTVTHEGKRSEFWYRGNNPVPGSATEARLDLGKGLASRNWQFELVNMNGADFEFESIHLQMLELSRRV